MKYQNDIYEDCGDGSGCYTEGSRWSVIYAFGGILLILVAANYALQLAGVWNAHCRAIGACCGNCLNCVLFACIITVAVFRFNTFGCLAALSLFPTKFNDGTFSLDFENFD